MTRRQWTGAVVAFVVIVTGCALIAVSFDLPWPVV